MGTVGSQDTTGPMTRDELKELARLGFSADLVMQSFCHTAAYPKPVDIDTQHTLPDFIKNRGGVSLRPGDGIIHSWLNRMLLPDTVGTGGDSHTRFPMGISFPAGSGLVAFAAATGGDASGYARIRAGEVSPEKCSPALPCATWCTQYPTRDSARFANRGEEGQEERLQRPYPRDSRAPEPHRGAGSSSSSPMPRRALRWAAPSICRRSPWPNTSAPTW